MKTLSLFSGIGAFERGFEMAGINLEIVNYCEWDKYASKSYSAIHNISEKYNLGDITKVDERKLEDFDLMTYGFPCQDISVAGKQAGISEGTRSGLLYEALRIARHKKPKVMIAENVKALVSKKFKPDFEKLLNELEEMGYNNYWKVLNAKDYGIPQNRERVFVISIRKDIDKDFNFDIENKQEAKDFRDYLEDVVSEDYYLKDSELKYLKSFGAKYSFGGKLIDDEVKIYGTITASYGKTSGNSMKFYRKGRISYLTPLECWRLMGFIDEDFEKAKVSGISNTQLYKQAGNSIVTNVIAEIATRLKEGIK